MDNNQRSFHLFGFSLIELMVVIVIIGVLSAIAIPNYTKYVRRSNTAEAQANVNSIGQYEEQYFSENNRYASAGGNPANVPSSANAGGALPWVTTNAEWNELGAVFTNNTQLRFQYRAFAGQFNANAGSVTGSGFYSYTGTFALTTASTTTGGVACGGTTSPIPAGSASDFGVTATAYANWFVITAVGNQLLDTTCSLFTKVNDRPTVGSINPTD